MSYLDNILAAVNRGDLKAALDLVQENESAHGGEADFYSVKAMLCVEAGELETAVHILLDAQKQYPLDGDILYNLGFLSEQLGDVNAAYWFYFEAAQYIGDETLCKDVKARCHILEMNPAFAAHLETVLLNTPKNDLRSINYVRDPSVLRDLSFLMLRIESDIGRKHAIPVVAGAKKRGQVSGEWLRDYALSQVPHQLELIKIIERDL